MSESASSHELRQERDRLRAILDRPDPEKFIEASVIEARFQMDLWGTTEGFPTAFDGQEDHHFVYLVAYLAGKVAATPDEDREKKLHRITTVAAAAANWHIVASARAVAASPPRPWTCRCGNRNSEHRATCLACHTPGSAPVAGPADEALRAKIAQEFENDQVRRMKQTGRCPACGADA